MNAHLQPPSVTVVIPCWNAEAWIARAVRSVLAQAYPGLEVVVVDDGSADGSLAIVKSFGDRVRWITGPNRGACAARNAGLAAATTDWVLFVDADDYLESTLIADLARQATGCDLDLAIGASKTLQPDGALIVQRFPLDSRPQDLLRGWLDGGFVQTGAVLWRASFLRKIGGWRADVQRKQDKEVVLRAIFLGAKVKSVDAGFCVWDNHDGPNRISRRTSHASIGSEIAFNDAFLPYVDRTDAVVVRLMAETFYRLAVEAYSYGYPDLVRTAMGRARQLGFRGHRGPLRRRAVAAVVGLEACAHVRRLMLRRDLAAAVGS
ncbi:MAG TPA: glycosyltransferase [Caulobacteraceae bacterium]